MIQIHKRANARIVISSRFKNRFVSIPGLECIWVFHIFMIINSKIKVLVVVQMVHSILKYSIVTSSPWWKSMHLKTLFLAKKNYDLDPDMSKNEWQQTIYSFFSINSIIIIRSKMEVSLPSIQFMRSRYLILFLQHLPSFICISFTFQIYEKWGVVQTKQKLVPRIIVSSYIFFFSDFDKSAFKYLSNLSRLAKDNALTFHRKNPVSFHQKWYIW